MWPSLAPRESLCWGAAQCDAGRMAALESALRAVLAYVHPDDGSAETVARAFRLVSSCRAP